MACMFAFHSQYPPANYTCLVCIFHSPDTLTLVGKGIAGTLPSEIGLMTSLTEITIADSSVTGTIPTEMAQLSKLESFQIVSP
jgi:hypothetical protein